MNGALNNSQVSSDSTGKIVRAKLPKLRMKNFGGKFCEWPEFWDSFSSSIDNNDQLSDVDKFAYLRGYLEGQAKSTIAGLSLTATNYQYAVDLLKKRFEKKSAIQRTHVNDLIQLPAVFKERDTQRLWKLYDSCEAHNRALNSLDVNEKSYSTIVVPAILEKMPEQFRPTITRGTNFIEWTMQEMLQAFEKELELREEQDAVATRTERDHAGYVSRKTTGGQDNITAAVLVADQDKKSCAFCLKNHPHEECDGVLDPKTRKTLLLKYGRCFLCLVKGHRASNYSSKIKCLNCNRSHHVALCDASLGDELTRMSKNLILKKEPEMLKEYDRIIKEQAEQGIIEQVTSLEKADKVHYLPHQAVIRKDTVTTKVCIAYDASSKGSKSDTHHSMTVCILDHHSTHYFIAY